MTRSRRGLAAALIVALGVTACATSSPPMVLHTLVVPAPSTTKATSGPATASTPVLPVASRKAPPLGVAIALPVIPDEVDRAQLVMRSADGSIAMLDNERWAEPLKSALPRALALSMARRLPGALVAGYPATGLSQPAWRVSLEVQRFELQRAPTPQATLRVVWSLKPTEGAADGVSRLADFTVQGAEGSPTVAAVAAMTRAIERLSGEIAQEICNRSSC